MMILQSPRLFPLSLVHQSRKMSTEINVLKLPRDIVCELMTGWLDMTACGRLDSACCSTDHRGNVLNLIKRDCIFKIVKFDVDTSSFTKWVCLRSIHSSGVQIRNCKVGCDEYLEMCDQFLQTCGGVINNLEIEYCSSYITELTALYCNNLSRIRVLDCDLDASFWKLLAGNAGTLTDFHLVADDFIMISEMDCSFVCSAVRKLGIEDLYGMINDEHLIPIVQVFPNIVRLELQRDQLTEETLTTILNYCPDVVDLTVFTSAESMPANVLLSILGNRKAGYQALSLSAFTTDEEAVEAIMDNHAHSLQHLKLYATEAIANTSYIHLLNACTNLQSLEFGCSYTTGDKVSNILPYVKLSKLKVLNVESPDEFLMDNVTELTKYTPALEALSVTTCFDRGEADPRIPLQVQQFCSSCPQLQTVIIEGYYDDLCFVRVGQHLEVAPAKITINYHFIV